MNPIILGVMGPGFLNQVPTLQDRKKPGTANLNSKPGWTVVDFTLPPHVLLMSLAVLLRVDNMGSSPQNEKSSRVDLNGI